MLEPVRQIRWGVEKRLEFIEFCLFWEGKINRSDIIERFGVSVPQASKDLSQYREEAPKNIIYDPSEKRYLASPEFKPVFFKPNSDLYLAQLKSIADKVSSSEETWLSNVPNLDSMPIPHRTVDVTILRKVIDAVRNNRAIEIEYQSMNKERPDPVWRWITPHAFANDGFRWHVRAYCHETNKFKDFLLSRILKIGDEKEPGALPKEDHYWFEYVDVLLIPNPAYTKSQKEIIALDYGMKHEEISIPVRKALLYYFKKRLRLDVAEALDEPKEAPIVIKNRKEFEAALAES